MSKQSATWTLYIFGTGSSFSGYRDANGNIWLKLKETKAKNVAMATSQYSTSLFDVGFKFQLSLSGDIPRFMICVHSQSIYDGINFQMSRIANGMASASSCKNYNLSCRGKF